MKTAISNSSANNDDLSSEIYYLIQRFLSIGPCSESAELLRREIESNKLLPKRFDHTGASHRRSFDEYDNCLNKLISSDYLKKLCQRLPALLDSVIPPGVSNVKHSLFSGGKQSMMRESTNVPFRWTQSSIVCLQNGQNRLQPHAQMPCRIEQILYGRQMTSGNYKKILCSDFLTSRMELQTRIFGHLSCIFCVAFDRSGRYIFTGADDNLIKVWAVKEGRLIYTFRGFNGEITDLTVSHENTLLAAGSCDKTIRIWCLKTAAPIAVLQGHSAMVTSLQFLPYIDGENRWLISTGNDCCVCFWKWDVLTNQFNPVPVKFAERLRVGGQMICSSHSPGGRFIVTGGTDHYVRVYAMINGWPQRLIETEGHTDRVDSVQWAHKSCRFLTGSRDGVAKIWTFERQEWKTITLNITSRYEGGKYIPVSVNDPKTQRLKVTMVTWCMNDSLVVTAVSDFTLRVWDSKLGTLIRTLLGHIDEAYVLEPHPIDSKIILSAGHDGNLFLWNVITGEPIKKFFNSIEGMGHGAFFDVRFSIDGQNMAAVDSHGRLSMFGVDGREILSKAPAEQFFHTDYRPLLRDTNNYVVDEQTQIAPHLMPPPFLVNSDGDPYPPAIQRLVPGKENCTDAFLVPVVVHDADRDTNEVIDVENLSENEQRSTATIDTSSNGQETAANGSSRNSQPRNVEGSSAPLCAWSARFVVQPLNSSVLDRSTKIRKQLGLVEIEQYEVESAKPPIPICVEEPKVEELSRKGKKRLANHVYGTRRNPRLRHPPGQIDSASIPTTPLETSIDIPPPASSPDDSDYSDSDDDDNSSNSHPSRSLAETSDPDYSDVETSAKPRTRRNAHEEDNQDNAEKNKSLDDSEFAADSETEKIDREDEDYDDVSNKPSTSKSSISDVKSPKYSRPKRSRSTRKELYIPEDLDETRNRSRNRRVSLPNEPKTLTDVPEKFWFPDWITSSLSRKSPYFPQFRDEVVYYPNGHKAYIEVVERTNLYPVHKKFLPYVRHDLQDEEFALVVSVRFEISPIRLCCLKLEQLHGKTSKKTGLIYTVKYHDVPNVVDFIVLRQYYDQSLKHKWKPGDRFQAVIDDGWWFGAILKKESQSASHFLCYNVLWDNGDEEKLSPWDLEPFDSSSNCLQSEFFTIPYLLDECPTKKSASVPVSSDELCALVSYKCRSNEWPPHGMDAEIERLCKGIEKIMSFSLAEPFVAPVDVNKYPTYCLCVDYPSDLSTIKSRLENRFYRRLEAVEMDLRQIERNAKIFNEPRSQIVHQSRTLCDVLLKYLEEFECDDITLIYNSITSGRALSANVEKSTTDEELTDKRSSKIKRARRRKYITSAKFEDLPSVDGKEWMDECREIVDFFQKSGLFSNAQSDDDSEQMPGTSCDVSTNSNHSYKSIIKKLTAEQYENPKEFDNDVSALLNNMKTSSNQNKRSKTFLTTIRLSGQYQEQIKPILSSWKNKSNLNKGSSSSVHVYNTRKRNSPLKSFPHNNNDAHFNKSNNMLHAYQQQRPRSSQPLSATTANAATGGERRRVIVAHSDESDNDNLLSGMQISNQHLPPDKKPVSWILREKATPNNSQSSSSSAATAGTVISTSSATSAKVKKETNDLADLYSSTSANTSTSCSQPLPSRRTASRTVNYTELSDDNEDVDTTTGDTTIIDNGDNKRKVGKVDIEDRDRRLPCSSENSMDSNKNGKSQTRYNKKNNSRRVNNNNSDFEEDRTDSVESEYKSTVRKRPTTVTHDPNVADSDEESEDNYDDNDNDGLAGSDEEYVDENDRNFTKRTISPSRKTRGRPKKAKGFESTGVRTPVVDEAASSTKPKSHQLLRREFSTSSRDSSERSGSSHSTRRSKIRTDNGRSTGGNARTRFGGKRVMMYKESSDDEEDADGSGEPKIVLSTSSRGRVCKLRKYS